MTGAPSLRATVAATAIAGALLIAGCGGDDEPTASVAVTATTPTTPTATTTTTPAAATTTTTSTSGAGKQQSGKASTTQKSAKTKAARVRTVPIAPARAKVGKAQTFSGDGDKTLGTIMLKRSSVVRWTATGGSFALVDGAKKVSISGNAKSGQTFLAAGEYTSVKVAAKGAWTLSIAPLGD